MQLFKQRVHRSFQMAEHVWANKQVTTKLLSLTVKFSTVVQISPEWNISMNHGDSERIRMEWFPTGH